MSLRVAIESVLKEQDSTGVPRVRAVGGTTLGGGRWMLLEHQAINAIERGRSEFYVLKEGKQITVQIGVTPSGTKYLRTSNHPSEPEPLLELPDYNSKF